MTVMDVCQTTGPGRRALLLTAVGAAALLALAPGTLFAEAGSPWTEIPETRARLLATSTAVGADEAVTLGLQIQLKPGWKTYWRSPGDAGSPPRLDWTGSQNLAGAEVRWPVPERFTAFGLETLGYAGEVILPIRARLAEPGKPLSLRLSLDYQVCKDICIPAAAELALSLPAGPADASRYAAPVARYEAAVPRPSGEGGISIEAATVRTDGQSGVLEVRVTSSRTALVAPDLIVETNSPVYFGKPRISLSDDRRKALLRLPIGGTDEPEKLVGSELRLTLIDGAGAREARLVAAGPG